MKPAPFAYARARSVDDAIALLGTHGDGAKLLAGGQSLMATLNMRLSAPSVLIDINRIPDLDHIILRNDAVHIGALARHAAVLRSDVIHQHVPLLARAMPYVAHAAIRNRGTFGGSIAFADPAAELPACLLALGGTVEIAGPSGRRNIQADDFFTGMFETALGPLDVLCGVRIPAATSAHRCGFAELARRQGDYAIVGLAATAHANGDTLNDVRVVFFGVSDMPVRARAVEAALSGRTLDALAIDNAVAALDLAPNDDVQASAAVKTHLAGVLLRRVVAQMIAAP